LRKQVEDPQIQADITRAIDSIQNTLDSANEAIDKEHLAAAVVDLSERVDDWKSLKMDAFGDLLRFGTFAVVKGDSGKDAEREVCTSGLWPVSLKEPRAIVRGNSVGSQADTIALVSYLLVRTYSSMLQRHQPE
jgi:DNA-binding FrmR family transcriptional regulator